MSQHAVQHAQAQPEEHTTTPPPPDVSPRDWQIVLELARHDDAQVGFQGIKRSLDLHPETLRRSLRRLQRDGHVEKTERGYRLTSEGHAMASAAADLDAATPRMMLGALLLPTGVQTTHVVQALAGRWFEGLHWYGLAEGQGETTLQWLTADDDTSVRLRIGHGALRIETSLVDGDADEKIQAAAPLMQAVAQLVRERAGNERVAA